MKRVTQVRKSTPVCTIMTCAITARRSLPERQNETINRIRLLISTYRHILRIHMSLVVFIRKTPVHSRRHPG